MATNPQNPPAGGPGDAVGGKPPQPQRELTPAGRQAEADQKAQRQAQAAAAGQPARSGQPQTVPPGGQPPAPRTMTAETAQQTARPGFNAPADAVGPHGGHFPMGPLTTVWRFLTGGGPSWNDAMEAFDKSWEWAKEEFGPDAVERAKAEPLDPAKMGAPHGIPIAAGGPDRHRLSLADSLKDCIDRVTVGDAPARFAASPRGTVAGALPPWFLSLLQAIAAIILQLRPAEPVPPAPVPHTPPPAAGGPGFPQSNR